MSSVIDYGHKWVVEKRVGHKVKIHDLGLPDSKGICPIYAMEPSKPGEFIRYNLHEFFTWQQLCASTGLRTAEGNGWIITVEKIPPAPTTNTHIIEKESSVLEAEVSSLKGMIEQLIQNQAQQQSGISEDALVKFFAGRQGVTGQISSSKNEELANAAALKAFEKHGGNIQSSLDLSGNQKIVESNASEIADSLSQISFEEDEDN